MNCTHAILRLAPLLLTACVIGCSASTDSPQVSLEKAHIQKERGHFEDAIPLYDAAIALLPESTDAYYSRGDCYRQLGLFDQAVADFDACLKIDPQLHGARNDKGICLAESGQFAAAVDVFSEVIQQDPADAQAYRNRALSLYHQQKFQAAIRDYDQSLQQNADDPETWFQKGNAVRAVDRLPEAVECYTEAINRAPNFAYAWMNRGVARYQLGERKEGLAELTHASELNGDIVVPAIDWLNQFFDNQYQYTNKSGERDLGGVDFQHESTDGEQTLSRGTRVLVRGTGGASAQLFEYVGVTGTNTKNVNLTTEDYSVRSNWQPVVRRSTTKVRISGDHTDTNIRGNIYRFVGIPATDVDLGAEVYTDTTRWERVQTTNADFIPQIGNITDSDSIGVGVLIVRNDVISSVDANIDKARVTTTMGQSGNVVVNALEQADLRAVQQDVRTKTLAQVVHYYYLVNKNASRAERNGSPGPQLARIASPAPLAGAV